jgi:hypothetical protein
LKELIFKITSVNPAIHSLFHRYVSLFNELYSSRPRKAYFEVIDLGFLYILPTIEVYRQIAAGMLPHSEIQKIIQANSQKRAELITDFGPSLKLSKDQPIELSVEVINYTTEEVLPFMDAIFRVIVPNITFHSIDAHHYTIVFPNTDGFYDYCVMFLLQLQNSPK